MSEADEVARLKAELASLQQETAVLEKKPKKKKSKKEKKKRKSTEDDEAAKLRAELEAVEQETSALTGAPPPPEKKKRKKEKKAKADAPVDAPPARKKEPASDDAPPARRAYVGGLPFDATEESVSNYFSTLCGDLEKVEIQCFEDNPERCCGIAYVTFVEPDALDRALTLDGDGVLWARVGLTVQNLENW